MHLDVLTREQTELLPFLSQFAKRYYLVGGTAVALQLGHRQSIDFDLFTTSTIQRVKLRKCVEQSGFTSRLLSEDVDQIHFVVHGVKVTFFAFPYKVEHPVWLNEVLSMPSLLSLAAMKAFALGRRAKWKDYVDLFFVLRDHFPLKQVADHAKEIFGAFFNEKLFREQLCYYQDIDYSEKVDFVAPAVPDGEIKEFLTNTATTPFTSNL